MPSSLPGDRAAGQSEPFGGRVDDADTGGARLRVRVAGGEAGSPYGVVVGVQQGGEARRGVGREQQDVLGFGDLKDRASRHARAGPAHARGLLQHHMRVDPAEAERVDRGPANGPVRGGLPVGGLLQCAEPGAGQGGVRVVAVQCRKECAVVDGERGLDQTGDPGGRHGMPDHRLDRTQYRVTVSRAEHLGECGEFGAVACRGRGAVRLQQADRARLGGVESGRPPRLPYRLRLTTGLGVHETGHPSVARHAGTPDHGVDPVSGTLGVGQPLEDDNARPLTDQDAVGVPVEGPDALAGGECAQLGKDAPQRDVVAVVDAAA